MSFRKCFKISLEQLAVLYKILNVSFIVPLKSVLTFMCLYRDVQPIGVLFLPILVTMPDNLY